MGSRPWLARNSRASRLPAVRHHGAVPSGDGPLVSDLRFHGPPSIPAAGATGGAAPFGGIGTRGAPAVSPGLAGSDRSAAAGRAPCAAGP